jgi:NADH-quinone oxidoreductase subunit M
VNGFPYLSVITFLPLAGAVVCIRPEGVSSTSSVERLGISLATFVVAVVMLVQYDAAASGFQFVERASWVAPLHMQYLLGVDGISLFMVVLTTFLMPMGVLIPGASNAR